MLGFGGEAKRVGLGHPLRGNALLCDLSDRELKIVQGFVHARHYLGGEVVFDAGEEGQALYFVCSGEILICHPGQREHPLARLGAGAFFGEMALLDDSPRSAQAVAAGDSQLLALFRGDFERLMLSHAQIASKIALQLARHLGQRLRQMLAGPAPETGHAE